MELRRKQVNDLPSIITAANVVVDLNRSEKADASSLQLKGKDAKNKGKGKQGIDESLASSKQVETRP